MYILLVDTNNTSKGSSDHGAHLETTDEQLACCLAAAENSLHLSLHSREFYRFLLFFQICGEHLHGSDVRSYFVHLVVRLICVV